eukprot:g7648.t1
MSNKALVTADSLLDQLLPFAPLCLFQNLSKEEISGNVRKQFSMKTEVCACAVFDISGFSKLASKLQRDESSEDLGTKNSDGSFKSSNKYNVKKKNNVNKRKDLKELHVTSDHVSSFSSFSSLDPENSGDVKFRKDSIDHIIRQSSSIQGARTISQEYMLIHTESTHKDIAMQQKRKLHLLNERYTSFEGQGAEKLAKAITQLFAHLVEKIHDAGGDIIKFAGDALICIWSPENMIKSNIPLGNLIYHAVHCGFELSTLVKSIKDEGTDKNINLGMHVSVGAGPVNMISIGGSAGRWEFLTTGRGYEDACNGVDLSKTGEMVVSNEAYIALEKELKKASKLTGEALYSSSIIEDKYDGRSIVKSVLEHMWLQMNGNIRESFVYLDGLIEDGVLEEGLSRGKRVFKPSKKYIVLKAGAKGSKYQNTTVVKLSNLSQIPLFICQLLSVFGVSLNFKTLVSLQLYCLPPVPLTEGDIEKYLKDLLDWGVLGHDRVTKSYHFTSPKVRDQLFSSLTFSDRTKMHLG